MKTADSIKQIGVATNPLRGRTLEVTGLGVIAGLIVAFWSLVRDGTLPLSEYLVFVAFLLVSVGGLVWRMVKLAPVRRAESAEQRRQ